MTCPHSWPAHRGPSASPADAIDPTIRRRPAGPIGRIALGATTFFRLIAQVVVPRRGGQDDVRRGSPGQIAGSTPPRDQVRTYWQARRPS
jgi:hypothetical protein